MDCLQALVNNLLVWQSKCESKLRPLNSEHLIRPVHTTKIMRVKSKLIRIVTVHTECALTVIRFEFTFSQSTSIGGLKPD